MYKIGIITMSDKGSQGLREDTSGAVIREMAASLGTVEQYRLVPDDPQIIQDTLIEFADVHRLDLVLTTGGTGLGPRDHTPEATLAVIDRQVPGIAEAIRAASLAKTPKAMLSRAVSGIRGSTLIINLPGSVKGVRECLAVVLPVLPHGLEILSGRGGECGQP
ncbi:MogA/MoaB family molybdenum cofactor biosynthesis protein [Desulforamulus hydrothermalis]|uniref:Molybdenum cofactor synthesis domain protein n=1 Tax=Desulforamulus hydrothermalis Lam5 = DSM 18033 TaxID=1121428 RepID=K8E957_9FIRM|nr:MogA/MoaB family molybdenum cofactor biosynthesis protein [Desulforamulus hydrothermalis]CCO08068.1 Molybdenum cofactor synthesis domain protein [Desulforamulus hydrothermalis Lam5 = DSM 18033]SHG82789.1 molybdopterin adenylyltransferase [Desulforamulus hydrothermalis Lam5 = DSM 18033]